MKFLKFLRQNWAMVLQVVGFVAWLIGESTAAFDRIRGNTTSEFFDRLPQPAKYAVVGLMFLTLGHWCWPLPPKIEVKAELDVEVKASQ